LIMLVDSPDSQLVEVLPDQLERFEVAWRGSRQTIEQVERQLIEYLDGSSILKTMKVNISEDWSSSFRRKLSDLPGNKDGDIYTLHELELVLI